MGLYVLRSPQCENPIFSVWFMYMCVSVCVSVISITQKQITRESSNLAFYICIIRKCYLKLFIKIGQKLCTGTQKRILTHYGLWMEFIVSEF